MERKEFRKQVKDFFKRKGYSSQKSFMYKIFDDDYMIGIGLDPSSYSKGYRITAFANYLPDDSIFPLRVPNGELRELFVFPINPGDELNITPGPMPLFSTGLTDVFEYEKYTPEQLEYYLSVNFDVCVSLLMDKEYGLNTFRSDWRSFGRSMYTKERIKKICLRAGIDPQDVFDYLDWYYKQNGRLRRTAPGDQKYFRQFLTEKNDTPD